MQLINIKESKSSNIKHSMKSIENSFKRYWYNFINCNLLNTKASINCFVSYSGNSIQGNLLPYLRMQIALTNEIIVLIKFVG